MSEQLKPIKLYGGVMGPNPPKVAIVLEELEVPYESVLIPFSDVKKPKYTAINPNGRLPSICDPNTDITIWESGAIVLYLVDRYDNDNKISFAHGSKESYLAQQWLIFQVSGQGPPYGQRIYFERYHSEKLPSVLERFTNEIERVTSVLDKYLGEHEQDDGSAWLVGNKFSFADLSFVIWQSYAHEVLEREGIDLERYAHVAQWIETMSKRPAIKKVWDEHKRVMEESRAGRG